MNTFIELTVLGTMKADFQAPIVIAVNVDDIKRFYYSARRNKNLVVVTSIEDEETVTAFSVQEDYKTISALLLAGNGPAAKILFKGKRK